MRADLDQARLMVGVSLKARRENQLLHESNAELRRLLEEARRLSQNIEVISADGTEENERARLRTENVDLWWRLRNDSEAVFQKVDVLLLRPTRAKPGEFIYTPRDDSTDISARTAT